MLIESGREMFFSPHKIEEQTATSMETAMLLAEEKAKYFIFNNKESKHGKINIECQS
jgi:hypothetical protein